MENIRDPYFFGMYYKGMTCLTQREIVFEYLQTNVATASMVSQATKIPQKCITRYKRDLEKAGMLWELERKKCKETGFFAWYLTTDPKKRGEVQLRLF